MWLIAELGIGSSLLREGGLKGISMISQIENLMQSRSQSWPVPGEEKLLRIQASSSNLHRFVKKSKKIRQIARDVPTIPPSVTGRSSDVSGQSTVPKHDPTRFIISESEFTFDPQYHLG